MLCDIVDARFSYKHDVLYLIMIFSTETLCRCVDVYVCVCFSSKILEQSNSVSEKTALLSTSRLETVLK